MPTLVQIPSCEPLLAPALGCILHPDPTLGLHPNPTLGLHPATHIGAASCTCAPQLTSAPWLGVLELGPGAS